jgi:serine phosphatase RsbU (regulator of sigma subunit)
MFVTVFRARLDTATGVVRYVDAGHGHCRIRRSNGDLEPLPHRSYPVGVDLGGEFVEGEVQLEYGDMLVVYSDGLVESETGTGDLAQFSTALDGTEHAAQLVSGLMAGMPIRPADDITLVVLRRLPETSEELVAAGAGSSRTRSAVAGGR